MPDDMMLNRTPDIQRVDQRPRAGQVTGRALSAANDYAAVWSLTSVPAACWPGANRYS